MTVTTRMKAEEKVAAMRAELQSFQLDLLVVKDLKSEVDDLKSMMKSLLLATEKRNDAEAAKKMCLKGVLCFTLYRIEDDASQLEELPNLSKQFEALLQQYDDVFQEVNSLPPSRDCDHTIPLVPGATPANIRRYIIPHYKKNALEKLVKEMLENQMIRHSTGPYSSLVVLVRKKDGAGDSV